MEGQQKVRTAKRVNDQFFVTDEPPHQMRMHCVPAVASIWLQLTTIKMNTFTGKIQGNKTRKKSG